MCGINGILNKVNHKGMGSAIEAMNNLIIHRGPDSEGRHINKTNGHYFAHGMRRLSIIDLSHGDQPMYSDDRLTSIVFNGEIYNFLQLKSLLLKDGVTFKTNSDTEVILRIYENYGYDGFKLLDGMYAFSIADNKKGKLILARDYFGEKPLYYYQSSNKFIYASELKCLIQQLDHKPNVCTTALNLYFRLTYIPAPYSIYEDVKKLEPNTMIMVDMKNLDMETHPIHKSLSTDKIDINFDEAKQIVYRKVYDSVRSRSISDVPLGTFLSGGVDSSIVSWCLADASEKRINTFSIGFENKDFDETDKSQTVADLIKSHHHKFILDEGDLAHNLNDILLNFDEPFADSSALPTFLVSQKTSQHVKVALTGDGGDEIFGGYNKYYVGKLNQRYTRLMPKSAHKGLLKVSSPFLRDKTDNRKLKYKINRMLNAINYDDRFYWDIISLGFSQLDVEEMINVDNRMQHPFSYYKSKTGISHPKTLTDFRIIDQHISLEGDMLVKVDRTSMLNSLECRAPFLNKDLFDFTLSLPDNFLLNGWSKKHILKKAFEDKFPKGFLDKSKHGFGVPVGNWLRSSLKSELLSYIEPNRLIKQDIFQVDDVTRLVKEHLSSRQDNSFKVWTFYCFQKWYFNTYMNI